MGKNTSFSIGDHLGAFIATQVEQGRYSSASDVVRAALRLLEEQEVKLAGLRAALIEGEQVVFYRSTSACVEIVRILHNRMDVKTQID